MLSWLRQRSAPIPTPLAGLALAIASVGMQWDLRLGLGLQLQTAMALLATALLLPLALKFTLNSPLLNQELRHPVLAAVMPTFAMALMMLSVTLASVSQWAGALLWSAAVVLHLWLLWRFIVNVRKRWGVEQMAPPWFIPTVGIVVAPLTSPAGLAWLDLALMWFGLICCMALLPLMLYRLIFLDFSDGALQPTFGVMAAPVSMALAGYLKVVAAPHPALVLWLLSAALLFTCLVYLLLPKLLRLPFSPSFAALTFPLVVSATALELLVARLPQLGWDQLGWGLVWAIQAMADLQLLIATVMVTIVAVRFALHGWGRAALR
ncbi:TDT family transporter [uncultured Ferrimonas sp.]|uniref:TDT family transporter n=1 Tax=uncultured Ferrimonas sp. TaxID=432640 RepID=UPI0026140EB8|nr:TDT family transporter [uncultured Ferrimonas sp.]